MINQEDIDECFGTHHNIEIGKNIYKYLGLINTNLANTISYINNNKYIHSLLNNKNITACFISQELVPLVNNSNLKLIIVDDPTFYFYTLYNFLVQKKYPRNNTKIDVSSSIHKSAVISDMGVSIGKNCKIGANTVIEEGTIIGDNVTIGNNTTLGCEDIELKNTSQGIIRVAHNAQLIIKNNVYIGSNCIITKGIYNKETIIHENVSISGNTHISHSSTVGANSMVLGAHICGSCNIGENVKIYPNAVISNGITIENNAEITLGSVVITNVKEGSKVSGNFAYDHLEMLRDYGKKVRKK